MNNFFIYLLESGICLSVFYLMFLIMFRMDTFFVISRTYILCSMIVSAIIPLFNFSNIAVDNVDVVPTAIFNAVTVEANEVENTVRTSIGVSEIILVIYLTGVIIFLARFILRMFQLIKLIRKHGINRTDGYKIVFTDDKYSPFSFFNIIFLGSSFTYNRETELILAHEKVHIDKHHSYDIILSEIITVFQWFNPFVWFYKKSLQEIHEYQADEGVMKLGHDVLDYQKLILNKIAGSEVFQTANNFNYSLIKRRIKMIAKNKTKRIALIKLFLILPVSMILFLSFSCSQMENSNPLGDVIRIPEDKIDSHAVFQTGWDGMWKYINSRINIPKELIDNNKCGKLAVRFEVDTDGSIENVRVAQSKEFGGEWKKGELGYGCDEEAIRVVKEMPKWKPAISEGKPVKLTQSLILFFGTKEMEKKWNETERDKDNWMETKTETDNESKGIKFKFPGGYDAMAGFIAKNINYPETARKNGVQGTVIVVFKIKSDGSISDVKIDKSVGSGCDEEAIRVIKLMPKLVCKSETPKSQEVKLPIAFKLSNDKSENKTESLKNNGPSSFNFVSVEKEPMVDMGALAKAIKYPEEARKTGKEGTVILRVLFKKTGVVGNIIVEKTDNKIFNEAAINAVKTVKFTPAMNKGKNIDMWVTLPINFKLK
ncbi:MAG: TonB family protein [Ignavibacteriae bacterium]|nr:TonB family protein [Ignavibacteriota bacterium]